MYSNTQRNSFLNDLKKVVRDYNNLKINQEFCAYSINVWNGLTKFYDDELEELKNISNRWEVRYNELLAENKRLNEQLADLEKGNK